MFMHNLFGIYNKCTTEVTGVRCNGKAWESCFFFHHLQVHDLTNSYFPLHLHSHSFSPLQCVPWRRAPSCWKMLLPAHLYVCVREDLYVHCFVCRCAYGRNVGARENTLSCFSLNGPAETNVSPTQRFQAAVKCRHHTHNKWGVRVGAYTRVYSYIDNLCMGI